MKLPSFIKLPKFRRGPSASARPRVMRATARRAQPAYQDYEDDEPTTRLSSAFIVVLALHLVAVGGIYAFHELKAHRKNQEILDGPNVAAAAPKPELEPAVAAPASDAAFVTAATPAPLPHPAITSPATVPSAHSYRVKSGDTMAKVAAQNTVSTADLASANNLKETSPLHVGQVLNLPASHTTAAAAAHPFSGTNDAKAAFLAARNGEPPPATGKTYSVAKGDNPVAIARKLGVSYDDLIKLNKIDDPKKLQVGQILKVPAKAPKTASN